MALGGGREAPAKREGARYEGQGNMSETGKKREALDFPRVEKK